MTFDEKNRQISVVKTTDARLANKKVIIAIEALVEEKYPAEFSLIINFKASLGQADS